MEPSDIATLLSIAVAMTGAALGAFLEIRGRKLFYTRGEGEADHQLLDETHDTLQAVQTRTELIAAEVLHHREDMVVRVVEPLEKITARLEAMAAAQAEHGRLLVQHAEQTRALGRSLDVLRDEVRSHPRSAS